MRNRKLIARMSLLNRRFRIRQIVSRGSGSVLEASSPPIVWLSTLLRRFGIILEKILDRHERSGIAVQWNGGLVLTDTFLMFTGRKILQTRHSF